MGLNTMNIKLISEEIIKPSSPTPSHLRFLRASLFDHVNSPILMPMIFFYYSQNHTTKIICTNEVLDRLKGSLPNTLSVFYPLAGRVQDANYFYCNDEGVPYVQTEVGTPLDDVIYKAEVSHLDKLLPPYGQEGSTKLLLAIQVNVFNCGGLAIGVKMSHAISDAFSLVMFVNTWASMAANGNNQCHHKICGQPYFDIWKLFPPLLPQINSKNELDEDQSYDVIKHRPVTKWFMFSKTKLEALRSNQLSYTNTTSNSETSLPSLPMLLSAFIWSRIKVTCHEIDSNIPHEVYHSANIRRIIHDPPIEQSYYFGNMVVNAIANLSMDRNNDEYGSISIFLERMKESIGRIMNKDYGFVKEMQDGKQDLRFMTEHIEKIIKGEIISMGFSNLRSLPMYEADFGWGKPIWVTSATLMYKGLIILIPAGPSTQDIVAYINLSSEEMVKLESDTEFIALVSKAPLIRCNM